MVYSNSIEQYKTVVYKKGNEYSNKQFGTDIFSIDNRDTIKQWYKTEWIYEINYTHPQKLVIRNELCELFKYLSSAYPWYFMDLQQNFINFIIYSKIKSFSAFSNIHLRYTNNNVRTFTNYYETIEINADDIINIQYIIYQKIGMKVDENDLLNYIHKQIHNRILNLEEL